MITLHAPTGVSQGSEVILHDGSATTVDADGNISVAADNALPLIAGGWQMTGAALAPAAGIAFSQIAKMLSDRVLNSPELAIGSTDTQVASGAFDYQIGAAAGGVNTFKKKGAVAAGTALAAGTIPINKWGVYLVSIDAAGTITVTGGAANGTTGYASEAAAIAALPATPASQAALGYFTVQTHSGTTFIGTTDALAGGTTGNEAAATNYYNAGLAY